MNQLLYRFHTNVIKNGKHCHLLQLQVHYKQNLQLQHQRNLNMGTRLGLLDPHLVLERGYAWLTDETGRALTHASDFQANQSVTASLADGQVNLQVK